MKKLKIIRPALPFCRQLIHSGTARMAEEIYGPKYTSSGDEPEEISESEYTNEFLCEIPCLGEMPRQGPWSPRDCKLYPMATTSTSDELINIMELPTYSYPDQPGEQRIILVQMTRETCLYLENEKVHRFANIRTKMIEEFEPVRVRAKENRGVSFFMIKFPHLVELSIDPDGHIQIKMCGIDYGGDGEETLEQEHPGAQNCTEQLRNDPPNFIVMVDYCLFFYDLYDARGYYLKTTTEQQTTHPVFCLYPKEKFIFQITGLGFLSTSC